MEMSFWTCITFRNNNFSLSIIIAQSRTIARGEALVQAEARSKPKPRGRERF
jgi:hypothetical protein